MNILIAWSVNVRVVQWIRKAVTVTATVRLMHVKAKTLPTAKLYQKAVAMQME